MNGFGGGQRRSPRYTIFFVPHCVGVVARDRPGAEFGRGRGRGRAEILLVGTEAGAGVRVDGK